MFLYLAAFSSFPYQLTYAEKGHINRLGNNDGLSNSSINTIFQDSFGLMWFGTWDGLNQYNGAEFTHFRPNPSDSTSISNNIIRNVFENQKGRLWITTDFGINRFDLLNNTFKSYLLGYDNKGIFRESSFASTKDADGNILASAYNCGLYIYDPETDNFRQIELPGVNTHNITHLFFDRFNNLWIVSDKHEIARITFSRLSPEATVIKSHEQVISPIKPAKIFYDKYNRLWIQNEKHSVSYLDLVTNKWHSFNFPHSTGVELNNVLHTAEGYLFATSSGLIRNDHKDGSFSTSLTGIPVLSVFPGSQGIVWVGSDSQGLFKLLPSRHDFNSFTKENIPELGNHAVRAIYKDENHKLWIGTKGGGLIEITHLGASSLQKTQRYTTADGLLNNSIFCLSPATHRNFWIGTDSKGINYYSDRQKKIMSLQAEPGFNLDAVSSVYALLQTNDTTLWAGTSGNGLFRFTLNYSDKNGYRVTHSEHFSFNPAHKNGLNNNIIYSLRAEGDSTLWIATRGGGLNKLNLKTNRFTAYRNNPADASSISNDDVISIYRDQDGPLWIGTSYGLNRMKKTADGKIIFERFMESNGLANSNIHGILQDHENHIWISTNKGISRINTIDGSLTNYFHNDGLQDNEFADGASLASDGLNELYFGGVNGFNVFHPAQIGQSNYTPPLFLSSFKIDNVAQPLDQVSAVRKISYKNNSLSFHFAILDYIANHKCNTEYRLNRNSNADENWIQLGSGKDIILSNLPSGKYELEIRYTNSDNIWSNQTFVFPFQITPPWWKSPFAYIAYISILLLLAYMVFKMQKFRLKMQHSVELEKLEKEKKEEVHQAKLRFFTNIAHEFSNSITLIYGPCERMISNSVLNEKDKNYLYIIKRSAERMQNQIQQLMEFRKAETGHLSLHFETIDVAEMIRYTVDNFLDMADQKKIELSLQLDNNIPNWVVDRDAFEKIIFNLISNAFKYTPVSGKITLSLNITPNGELCFTCSNNGSGIKQEDIPFLFNRFRVLDNFESQLSKGVYTRNGIGLAMCKNLVGLMGGDISAESQINELTTFTVIIPAGHAAENIETSEKGQPALQTIGNSTKQNTSDKRVLVVDDQAEIRQLIVDTLNGRYKTREAANGIQALEEVESNQPDLIICDIIMPEMDGISFLRQLKGNDHTKHIPVILLSSKVSIESQIEGLETGADMFLSKPFHPTHLLAATERILGTKEMVRQYVETPQAHAEQFNGKLMDRQDKEFMTQAFAQLSKNLDNEDYNQDALSSDLAISRVQLYRKIKKLTERTPSDFIRTFRLQEAEKRLKTTSRTVQEIMQECGFRNKAYFYREFAKLYNCTPKEYQNKVHSENPL